MTELIEELRTLNGGHRKYVRLSDEIRAKVRTMLQTGQTGEDIAHATGASRANIQKVKDELGLVKKRSKTD